MSTTVLYSIVWILTASLFLPCDTEETPFLTTTQCYGINTHLLEIECHNHNDEIVLNSLKLGSKQIRTNCTESKDPNYCCHWDSVDDCYFEYGKSLTATDSRFRKCYGKSQCWFIVVWALNIDNCPTSKFGMTTQYMTAEYMCVAKKDILEVCSPNGPETMVKDGKPIYLKSQGFPYLKKGACRCHIKSLNEDSHHLELKAINAEISEPQSLYVFDESDVMMYPMKNITHEMRLKGLNTIFKADGSKPGISLWYLPQREFAFYFVVNSSIATKIQVSCTPFKRGELFSKIERSRHEFKHLQSTKTRKSFAMLLDIDFIKIIIPIVVLLLIAVLITFVVVYRWKRKRKHNIKKVDHKEMSSNETIYDNKQLQKPHDELENHPSQFCSKKSQTDFECLIETDGDNKTRSSASDVELDKSADVSKMDDNGCVNKAFDIDNRLDGEECGIVIEAGTEN
ncbi:hypothetical protein Ahia01_000168000 [Argonauta hians]